MCLRKRMKRPSTGWWGNCTKTRAMTRRPNFTPCLAVTLKSIFTKYRKSAMSAFRSTCLNLNTKAPRRISRGRTMRLVYWCTKINSKTFPILSSQKGWRPKDLTLWRLRHLNSRTTEKDLNMAATASIRVRKPKTCSIWIRLKSAERYREEMH